MSQSPMNQLPRMIRVEQRYDRTPQLDIPKVVERELRGNLPKTWGETKPTIAIGVGSRGISNLSSIVGAVVEQLQSAGAVPFIFPAMGSHGGATPQGQREILANYGITESAMGVPIRDSLDTVEIGRTEDDVPVYCSTEALNSDGILLINRIKPHTDFFGALGSGLLKMSVIGLGKRHGAATMHLNAARLGYEKAIRSMAKVVFSKAPMIGGIAIIENQFHETARIAFIERDRIPLEESRWLEEARRLMPLLPFDEVDLLIVDRIGKEISGAGMDPNVINRSVHGYSSLLVRNDQSVPFIRRIYVRELSRETHGNAIGIGMADATSARLVASIDRQITNINALTANTPQSAKIPVTFENDRQAIETMLSTLPLATYREASIVRIADTLSVAKLEISERAWDQAQARPNLSATSELHEMQFDGQDNLV